jgi:NADPH2:quinone reductase
MRAYHVATAGAPPALQTLPRPEPGAGEIRVRITACGLNFADLLMLDGTYQETPEPPFTLGMEVAGTVEATGPGVADPTPGTRVAVFGGHGGLAEYGCFPAARAVALPDAMDAVTAAAFQVAYGTSHVALAHRARLAPGERLLVLGAAGGVGLTAVEIGRAMGAEVIACARGAEKLEVARRAGAHHLIPADPERLRTEVRALGGADVVYDPVGGELFEAAFRACRPEARLLHIGFASSEVPRIKANHLLVKNLTVMGVYWGGYMAFRPEVVRESLAELMRWHGEGRLAPHVSHVLPLDRVEEGLALLRERRSTGKVVIRPD